MKLPATDLDWAVRDFIIDELKSIEDALTASAEMELDQANEADKDTTRPHFQIARHRERAFVMCELRELIRKRREELQRDYDNGRLKVQREENLE